MGKFQEEKRVLNEWLMPAHLRYRKLLDKLIITRDVLPADLTWIVRSYFDDSPLSFVQGVLCGKESATWESWECVVWWIRFNMCLATDFQVSEILQQFDARPFLL